MALSDERIKAIFIESWGAIPPPALLGTEMVHARAIEAEVRKQDDELIRQMLEALETAGVYPPSSQAAITAARARLGEKT